MVKKVVPKKLRLLAGERMEMRDKITKSAIDDLATVKLEADFCLDDLVLKHAKKLLAPELKKEMMNAGIGEMEAESRSKELTKIMSDRVSCSITVNMLKKYKSSTGSKEGLSRPFKRWSGVRENALHNIERVETDIIRCTAARAVQQDPRKIEMLTNRIRHLDATKKMLYHTKEAAEFLAVDDPRAIRKLLRLMPAS